MKHLVIIFCLYSTGCWASTVQLVEQISELKVKQSQAFYAHSRQLAADIHDACQLAVPGSESFALQQRWHETMLRWMPLQGEAKGPITNLNLVWSFQFWPDKRNLVGRKIKALLQEQTTFTSADIEEQSVVVHGLSALELLLFEQGLSKENCSLTQAIAETQAGNAKLLVNEWPRYAQILKEQAGNQDSQQIVTTELIASMSHQLSFVNKKFVLPLGKAGLIKPYLAESWRAGSSLTQLRASYTSIQTYYQTGIRELLQGKGHTELAADIDKAFTDLLENWPKQESMKQQLNSKAGLKQLYRSQKDIERLTWFVQDVIPAKLKIVLGFNATDGD